MIIDVIDAVARLVFVLSVLFLFFSLVNDVEAIRILLETTSANH